MKNNKLIIGKMGKIIVGTTTFVP